jgi:hypothetical protein
VKHTFVEADRTRGLQIAEPAPLKPTLHPCAAFHGETSTHSRRTILLESILDKVSWELTLID